MNKYLLLSAAAVLAGTSGAIASSARGGAIDLGNGCGLVLTEVQKGVYAVQYNGCGGSGVETGQGLSRKTAQGKSVQLSDNYFGNDRSTADSLDISLPLKNGGTWALWIEFSGTSSFIANSGTYTVGAAAKKTGGNVMAETRALIARLRAARGKL